MKLKLFIAISVTFLSLFLSACNAKQQERYEALTGEIEQVIQSSEPVDETRISYTIDLIDRFLTEYPDSEYNSYLLSKKSELETLKEEASYLKLKEEYAQVIKCEYPSKAIEEHQRVINLFNSSHGIALREKYSDLNTCLSQLERNLEIFQLMNSTLEASFSNIADFNQTMLSITPTYQQYGVDIARVWEQFVDIRRKNLADNILQGMVRDFETYLSKDAEEICTNDYENFKVQRIETVSLSTPTRHKEYVGYQCEGVFRVYLVGAFLGWDKGSIKISVKGKICMREDENKQISGISYSRDDFSYIERSGF